MAKRYFNSLILFKKNNLRMINLEGWFRVYRKLWEKPIWIESTPEQKTILVTLLSMANYQGKQWEWQGKEYKLVPGQFITSLDSIVTRCGKGVSIQNVRTALKRFERLGFLTNQSTNKNRLITIRNWQLYQRRKYKLTKNVTGYQQGNNKQLTPNKNVKNEKKVKNYSDPKPIIYNQDSVPYKLSLRLLKKIRSNHPEFKEPNLQKWSSDFQLMLEKDSRKIEEITYIIDWCQQNSFWKSNILSPTKIRNKYDVLVMKIKSEKERKQFNNPSRISLDRPNHWKEPEVVAKEELEILHSLEKELPY
jgi:hypothetical protein